VIFQAATTANNMKSCYSRRM